MIVDYLQCVGDLALYLVTRNLTTADILDPAKSGSVDFPESVVGLLKGELGFPHRGFPKTVEDIILKGGSKLTIRAGLVLPPVDFQQNIDKLSAQFNVAITPEQGMSSLMYPKVFSDYMKRQQTKGGSLLRYLPSLVYFYGVTPGTSFTMTIPANLLKALDPLSSEPAGQGTVTVNVALTRVSSLKEGKRAIVWSVNGHEQVSNVKDNTGVFVFEGPMADAANSKHVSCLLSMDLYVCRLISIWCLLQMASPMPGIVEKMLVKDGQSVASGDVLCTVSAMKMEVKVTAPFDGVVASVPAPAGTRVVEGALLITIA
jgi:pyruvate carboxylase